MMLFYSFLILCFVTSVISEQIRDRESSHDFNYVFSSWPINRHEAKITLQKREAVVGPLKPGQSDTAPLHVDTQTELKTPNEDAKGTLEQVSEGDVEIKSVPNLPSKLTTKLPDVPSNTNISLKNESSPVSGNETTNANGTVGSSAIPPTVSTMPSNITFPKMPSYQQPDLSNPGVMKRGLIVFGAFALMAIAYFIFYRRKNKKNDSNNAHGTSDANQFRYGVLESDDRRDNLELSRIPLTMESDDDEDEDLEIFDLEQKKKSLSYVNLQASDEYIVHESKDNDMDRDNLLLDIEDANSDQLINWSSNSNKSIL